MQESQGYISEIWHVKKDDIYSAIYALDKSLEYVEMLISQLEFNVKPAHAMIVEILKKDLENGRSTLAKLRKLPG